MPRLRNLLRKPGVVAVRALPPERGRSRVSVEVEGLACDSICARRTERALRGLPGVTDVRFIPSPDRFEIASEGPPPDLEAAARAVRSVVVAPWARRWIAALAERLGLRS